MSPLSGASVASGALGALGGLIGSRPASNQARK